MVDRERVADVLRLPLAGPRRSCRDVNEHTWQVAWASLSDEERDCYRGAGRALEFADDIVLPTGACDLFIPAVAPGQ